MENALHSWLRVTDDTSGKRQQVGKVTESFGARGGSPWIYGLMQVTGLLSLSFPTCKFRPQCRFVAKPQTTFLKNKSKNQVLGTSQLRPRGCEIPLLRTLWKPSNEEERRKALRRHCLTGCREAWQVVSRE